MAEIEKRGPQMVLAYIDQRLGEGSGRYNVKRELQHCQMVLSLATYLGAFHRNLKEIFPPFFQGGYRPRKTKLTRDEAVRLCAELEEGRGAHVAFILGTGARKSEAENAAREDIGPDHVRVRGTKTETADDDIPITPIAREWVDAAAAHAPNKSGLLFAPWGNIRRDLHAACVRAGIPKVTPNDLRRTFGSWHRDAGVPLAIVARLLRHTTDHLAQTTYAKLDAAAAGKLIRDAIRCDRTTVPNLYLEGSKTDKNSPKPDALGLGKNGESSEKWPVFEGAGHESRTRDLRLGKPWASRVSDGSKIGRSSKRAVCTVPNLYGDVGPNHPVFLPAAVDVDDGLPLFSPSDIVAWRQAHGLPAVTRIDAAARELLAGEP
jgi:hypothetical protein